MYLLAFIRTRKFHLIAAAVWAVLLVPSLLWWRESIVWLVFMSWYANFITHIDAYVSAKK